MIVLLVVPLLSYAQADYFYDIPVYQTSDVHFNGIEFNDVRVHVDGKKENGADEDGGKIDAQPFDRIKIRVEVESSFDSQSNIRVKDVVVSATIIDISGTGRHVRDVTDEFTLKAGDEDNQELVFTVPADVEEGRYDLILKALGFDDRNDARYGVINYILDVDKDRSDLIITDKDVNSKGYCEGLASISLEIVNAGKDNENVDLAIYSDELGMQYTERIRLDDRAFDDNKYYGTYKLINPKLDAPPGIYQFDILLSSSSTAIRDTATISVPDCGEYVEMTTTTYQYYEEPSGVVFSAPSAQAAASLPAISSYYPTMTLEKKERKTSKTWLVIAVIAIIDIILILVLILVITSLKKEPKKEDDEFDLELSPYTKTKLK